MRVEVHAQDIDPPARTCDRVAPGRSGSPPSLHANGYAIDHTALRERLVLAGVGASVVLSESVGRAAPTPAAQRRNAYVEVGIGNYCVAATLLSRRCKAPVSATTRRCACWKRSALLNLCSFAAGATRDVLYVGARGQFAHWRCSCCRCCSTGTPCLSPTMKPALKTARLLCLTFSKRRKSNWDQCAQGTANTVRQRYESPGDGRRYACPSEATTLGVSAGASLPAAVHQVSSGDATTTVCRVYPAHTAKTPPTTICSTLCPSTFCVAGALCRRSARFRHGATRARPRTAPACRSGYVMTSSGSCATANQQHGWMRRAGPARLVFCGTRLVVSATRMG